MENLLGSVPVDLPSQEDGLVLVRRLLDGDDPLAPGDFCAAYFDGLVRALHRRNPNADEADLGTAVEDALLGFMARPEAYDAGRGTLDVFLRLAADRDLKNVQRKEYRHWKRQTDWGHAGDDVDDSQGVENYGGDPDDDPAKIVERWETIREKMDRLKNQVVAAGDGLSPGEMAALRLLLEHERKTERYVEVLGLQHLAPNEQRKAVKRLKDKLTVRLKRAGVYDV